MNLKLGPSELITLGIAAGSALFGLLKWRHSKRANLKQLRYSCRVESIEKLKSEDREKWGSVITPESAMVVLKVRNTGGAVAPPSYLQFRVNGTDLIGPSLYTIPKSHSPADWEVVVGQDHLAFIQCPALRPKQSFEVKFLVSGKTKEPSYLSSDDYEVELVRED